MELVTLPSLSTLQSSSRGPVVTITGSNGRVGASQALLAAASPVLRRLESLLSAQLLSLSQDVWEPRVLGDEAAGAGGQSNPARLCRLLSCCPGTVLEDGGGVCGQ